MGARSDYYPEEPPRPPPISRRPSLSLPPDYGSNGAPDHRALIYLAGIATGAMMALIVVLLSVLLA